MTLPFPPKLAVAPMLPVAGRIALTARCRDADALPKVPRAGEVESRPDGSRVQILHNGILVPADGYYGAWMTELIGLCRGHHEPQEERAFDAVLRTLPPGGAMLEIGGHWSYYSAWFLSAAPGRRAVIVEPDPKHLAVGRETMALNGLSASFHNGFLDAEPGPPRPFRTEASGTLDLPAIDPVALLAAEGIERLDILHCDAQGAELPLLRLAAPLFAAGRVRWVFASTHHHRITGDPLTHQRCLALLAAAGAVIEMEHTVQESFAGDGLIVARFGEAPTGWAAPPLSRARAGESLFRDPLHDLAERWPGVPEAGR